MTQFGRALSELNIDIICANSPQAKGRVERAFGTLQDRLVKELRLAGISTIAAANTWLPGFIITAQWPLWLRAGERQGSAPEADAGEVGEGRLAATRGNALCNGPDRQFADLLQRNQGIDHGPGSGTRDL